MGRKAAQPTILSWTDLRAALATRGFGEPANDTLRFWLHCDPPIPVVELGGRGRGHKFDLDAVCQWLESRRSNQKQGWTSPEEISPKDELARLRLVRERVDLERYLGTLVDAEQVGREIESLFSQVRAKLLAVPAALAAPLGNCRTTAERQALLTESISTALEDLANGPTRTSRIVAAPASGDRGTPRRSAAAPRKGARKRPATAKKTASK
jgi:hypothetical protein